MERGVQIEVTFCAYTWKDVCKLMNISMYHAKNYWFRIDPRDQECIDEPLLRYARFDSGELTYVKPEWRGKLMKLIELQNFINEHRKICPTYHHTIKKYEKK